MGKGKEGVEEMTINRSNGKNSTKSIATTNILTKNLFCKSTDKKLASKNTTTTHSKSSKMTDELSRDIQLLRMRGSLDPKQPYKSSTSTNSQSIGSKEFVQYGTVIESSYEYYSNGGPTSKKQRNKSLLDSLMEDEQLRQTVKLKSAQIENKRKRIKGKRR